MSSIMNKKNIKRKLIFCYFPSSSDLYNGVNLSPEFNFKVICSNQDDKVIYILEKDDLWIPKKDIYESENLIQVSAIVGSNESGKTTFFRKIANSSYFEDIETPLNKLSQYIYVFLEDDRLSVYYKIEVGKFTTNISGILKNDCSSLFERKNPGSPVRRPFRDISVIYYTNSYFEKWADGSMSNTCAIGTFLISPIAEAFLADTYFQRIIFYGEHFSYPIDEELYWKQILARLNVARGFQRILDILYYKRCLDNCIVDDSILKSIFQTSPNNFSLVFDDVSTIMFSDDKGFASYRENVNPWKQYYKKRTPKSDEFYKKCLFWNGKKYDSLLSKLSDEERRYKFLYLNILFEYCLEKHMAFPARIKSLTGVKRYLNKELTKIPSKNRARYFVNAMQEVDRLAEIGDKCPKQETYFKPDGLTPDYHIDFVNGTEAYSEFLEFFKRLFLSDKSFIMKYFSFSQKPISAGRRCVQNLSEWLSLLPEIVHITGSNLVKLYDNVLIMFDEIDLNLHPEWQRTIVYDLLEELKKVFNEPEQKVQLMLSTHSPICLSDIPSENTAYFCKDEKGYYVKNRNEVKQTFGKEIFLLYKDSFFLSNTMGKLSTERTNKLLEFISDTMKAYFGNGEVLDSCLTVKMRYIEDQLQLIGNTVIKRHIETLLKVLKGDA